MLIVSIMQKNKTIFIVKLCCQQVIKHQTSKNITSKEKLQMLEPYMKSLKALVCILTVVESNDSSYCIKFVNNLSLKLMKFNVPTWSIFACISLFG